MSETRDMLEDDNHPPAVPAQGTIDFGERSPAMQGTLSVVEGSFPGMRIARVELRNFGTYDGPATVFDFGMAGAVIAGGNGMGKSTAFDAIKVAFVMNPELNSAAGEKGERSVTSYYRGAFGDRETDDGRSEESTLRNLGDPDKTTGILVEFRSTVGRCVTAVRLLYIDRQGARTWRYILGTVPLSLDRDFPRVATEKALRDRGDVLGYTVHQTYREFMKGIARELGMESAEQAQRAFHLQSIATGLPQMKSTTEFARSYILPPDNFLVEVAKAVESIEQHGEIRDKIRAAERQLRTLDAICDDFDRLEERFMARATLLRAETQIDIVREFAHVMQARQSLRINSRALSDARAKLAQTEGQIQADESRLKDLREKIEAAGGNRIDGVENNLRQACEDRDRRTRSRDAILEAAGRAGFRRNFGANAADWAALEAAIPQERDAIGIREADNRAGRDEAVGRHRDARRAVEAIQDEIRDVENSRSAMPKALRDARREIAAALGLSDEDLPFYGELLQVENSHLDEWELAANRLLGGKARNILVPERHYRDAQDHLPKLRQKAHVRLEKVSDLDICPDAADLARDVYLKLPAETLARKIAVKDDHPLSPHALRHLAADADYHCCADDDFGRFAPPLNARKQAKKICPRGAHSDSGNRAEIDNRDTEFVLGWSVERRLDRLRSRLDTEAAVLEKVSREVGQYDAGAQTIAVQRENLQYLERILKPWTSVDTTALDARIGRLERDLKDLQTPQIKAMRDERAQVEERLRSARAGEKILITTVGEKSGLVESDRARISEARSRMQAHCGRVALDRADYARIRDRLSRLMPPGATRNAGNFYDRLFPYGQSDISRTFRQLVSTNTAEIDNIKKRISDFGIRLDKEVDAYFGAHGNERGLPRGVRTDDEAGAAARAEWRARRDRVRQQDLPRAEARAAEFRKTTLHQQVLTLRNKLHSYDKRARDLADGINRIMAGNVFNPATGSFARLKFTRSRNAYVGEFQGLLEAALDRYSDLTDEEVFDRINAIAGYLRDEENAQQKARRREISALANRFDAEVEEFKLLDDGTRKMVRRITGAGTLSGGEKDRLSAFLLAAAMKCAFNAHEEVHRAAALHTILVDEAFMRSTDENAAAQIGVLDSFGLQIIAATPMTKIRPFQPVIGSVFIVGRPTEMQTEIVRFAVEEIDLATECPEEEVPDFSGLPDLTGGDSAVQEGSGDAGSHESGFPGV